MPEVETIALPELFRSLVEADALRGLIEAALAEDLAAVGDLTTESIIEAERATRADLVARADGVAAGLPVIAAVLETAEVGEALRFDPELGDGAALTPGARLGRFTGSLGLLLVLERTLLNFVGHLSGVASLTRRYVDAVAGTRAVICDTRKTTPGYRRLDKYAVCCGGGTMHRLGLFDALLYKDNHLAHVPPARLAATLEAAIVPVLAQAEPRFVEVEVDRLEQLRAVLGLPSGLVDVVLLDNMSPEGLREAVALRDDIAPGVKLEASGGVTLDTVRVIAETGVDRISVGAITHSAPWLDIGLDVAVDAPSS